MVPPGQISQPNSKQDFRSDSDKKHHPNDDTQFQMALFFSQFHPRRRAWLAERLDTRSEPTMNLATAHHNLWRQL